MFPGDRVLVRMFTRKYLRALRSGDGRLDSAELAADATARLSIDGVHRLREALVAERIRLRKQGEDRLADGLTSAVRDLDSRIQILDDLLH